MARKKTVGLFCGMDDEQAHHVAACLESQGARVLWVDPEEFPADLRLSDLDGEAWVGNRAPAPVAWYVRYFHFSVLEDRIANRERTSFLTSWLLNQALCARVVNPVAALQQNGFKTFQLALLRAAGVPVPRTLVTNDPNRVRGFVDAVGDVIYKPVAGGAYASAWTAEDAKRLERLSSGPVIFQERIWGDNIRAHVLAGRVVSSSRIVSEELDYRSVGFAQEALELPPDVAAMCAAAASAVGMTFAALDLIRRPNGEFVVLEANPTPYFLVFEQRLGHPIGELLARWLIKGK